MGCVLLKTSVRRCGSWYRELVGSFLCDPCQWLILAYSCQQRVLLHICNSECDTLIYAQTLPFFFNSLPPQVRFFSSLGQVAVFGVGGRKWLLHNLEYFSPLLTVQTVTGIMVFTAELLEPRLPFVSQNPYLQIIISVFNRWWWLGV